MCLDLINYDELHELLTLTFINMNHFQEYVVFDHLCLYLCFVLLKKIYEQD